jgi:hypothetical protein
VVLTLASGWVGRVRRHGKAIAVSAGSYGAAILAFGLADSLPLALAALAAAGAADMSSGIFRQTLWNQTIPDHMRGRLAGIEQLSYSIGPTLGTARSGGVASVTSVPFSIGAGGAACVAGTVILCSLLPRFWRYRAETVSA